MKTPLLRILASVRAVALTAFASFLVTTGATHAAPYQFAQFTEVTSNKPFSFTNNGGTSATMGVTNAAVLFNFTLQTGLSTASQAAFLNLTPGLSTFTPASSSAGSYNQAISNLEKLTLTSGMNGTGTNFLTVFFTGDLAGVLNALSATLAGQDSTRMVTFSSDFGTF